MVMEMNTEKLEPIIVRSILENPSFMQSAVAKIDHLDFQNEYCGDVFRVMDLMRRSRKKITIKAVAASMEDDEIFEAFVDSTDIEEDREAFDEYVGYLHEAATKDFTIQTLEEAVESIDNDPSFSMKALARHVQHANRLIAEKSTRGSAEIHDSKTIVSLFLKKMEEMASIEGDGKGIPTGFDEIDYEINGMLPGKYICIAGRPGMGKTSLALNFLKSICRNKGNGLFFSQEMPADELTTRMVADIADVEAEKINKAKLSKPEAERVKLATEEILKWKINICDEGGITADFFEAKIREAHEREPLSFVGVDYLQLFSLAGLPGDNKSDKLGELSKRIKALSLNLGIPIIVLSQLNRELEKRPDKRPIPSDLRDTGAIEQDADIILFTYREEVYDPDTLDKGIAEIICAKNRNGRMFNARVFFEGPYFRFRDIPKEEAEEIENANKKELVL